MTSVGCVLFFNSITFSLVSLSIGFLSCSYHCYYAYNRAILWQFNCWCKNSIGNIFSIIKTSKHSSIYFTYTYTIDGSPCYREGVQLLTGNGGSLILFLRSFALCLVVFFCDLINNYFFGVQSIILLVNKLFFFCGT